MPTIFNLVANGELSDASHLNQYASAVNALESGRAYWAGLTQGSPTAYTATLEPGGANLPGTIAVLLMHATSGVNPTLALGSEDPLPLKSGGVALSTGALVIGSVVQCICAQGAWHVIGIAGAGLQSQIDALAATVAALSPGGGAAVSGTPDYSNTGGTGNRTSLITCSTTITINYGGGESAQNFVNGGLSETMWFNTSQAATGKALQFELSTPALITEARFYNGGGYSGTYGNWQWQSSNDNGATWRLFPAFAWVPAPAGGWTVLPGLETNTLGYKRYRLFGLNGTLNSANTVAEFEFRITGL